MIDPGLSQTIDDLTLEQHTLFSVNENICNKNIENEKYTNNEIVRMINDFEI